MIDGKKEKERKKRLAKSLFERRRREMCGGAQENKFEKLKS